MRLTPPLAIALVAAAVALTLPPATAQDDLASKLVNNPGAPEVNGARARLVDDKVVQGGKALRVVVPAKGKNNWDSVVESSFLKPVKAGDRLVIAFEARLQEGPNKATSATIPYIAVQMKAAPYSSVLSGTATIGPQWRYLTISGKADKDYPAGALKATIQIGNARQAIDFGPIAVLNMGQ